MPDPGPVASQADRRVDPREATSDRVKLVAGAGAVFDAVVVDRSLRGLRIQYSGAGSLPAEVTLLYPAAGAAYVARVVWRTPPYAGLSITRTVDMRTASGAEGERLRRLWWEHIAR
jgi:hypothetical protein